MQDAVLNKSQNPVHFGFHSDYHMTKIKLENEVIFFLKTAEVDHIFKDFVIFLTTGQILWKAKFTSEPFNL